jgi:hypothetical protein
MGWQLRWRSGELSHFQPSARRYHVKSADWPRNTPHPLAAMSGEELAKLPTYCAQATVSVDALPSRRDASLHSGPSAKSAGRIVRLRTVVIDKDPPVAAIAEKRSIERANVGRCLDPTGSFRIELSEHLQRPVLLFREQGDARSWQRLLRPLGLSVEQSQYVNRPVPGSRPITSGSPPVFSL